MKNLVLLLLLCVSSMMLSQQQNTQNISGTFIPDPQVTELYKIVKQNDHLKKNIKDMGEKSEKALNDANKMINELKAQRKKLDAVIALQGEELKKTTEMYGKQIEVKNLQITDLNRQLEESYTDAKKQGRKKFWRGFRIGGITVGLIGTGTAIYLLTR